MAVGAWRIQPNAFWKMSPQEFWELERFYSPPQQMAGIERSKFEYLKRVLENG